MRNNLSGILLVASASANSGGAPWPRESAPFNLIWASFMRGCTLTRWLNYQRILWVKTAFPTHKLYISFHVNVNYQPRSFKLETQKVSCSWASSPLRCVWAQGLRVFAEKTADTQMRTISAKYLNSHQERNDWLIFFFFFCFQPWSFIKLQASMLPT